MININPPKFWYQHKGIIAYLLYPLSILYYFVTYIKKILTIPYDAKIKIICVGNATIGGSGKTPIAILVAKIALEKNINIGFLTRGYGGNYTHAMRVNPDIHDAKLVGDEPLILAETAPVYVARNRCDGIKLAQKDRIDLIIMDDGMQNYQLKKDLTILVIDGKRGFGNEFIFPAGPLRQSVNSATNDADCLIITDGNFQLKTKKVTIYTKTEAITENIENKNYVAFSGIGNNEKFYETLERLGVNIAAKKSFPDHYHYTKYDLDELVKMGDHLITTKKDYVKIPKEYHNKISYLPIETVANQIDQLRLIIHELI